MEPNYEWAGRLYRSEGEMLRAIATVWITSGGSDTAAEIAETLTVYSAGELARECIAAWNLDQTLPSDPEAGSHMDRLNYSPTDLVRAFTAAAEEWRALDAAAEDYAKNGWQRAMTNGRDAEARHAAAEAAKREDSV
jgi:hypothetical protein